MSKDRLFKLVLSIAFSFVGVFGCHATPSAYADDAEKSAAENSDSGGSDQKKSTTGNSQASTALQGKVEDHEDALPPIEQKFRIGTKFDASALGALTPDNLWFPIPAWLGGKWHGETQTINYIYDYKSGVSSSMERVMKASSDIVYGMQKSKDGQTWTFAKVPKLETQEIEFGYAYLYAVRDELVKYSDSKLVLKFFYYEVKTDRHNKILSVERISSINNYTQLDDGLVRLKASLKSFYEDGQPKILQTSEKVLKQIEPYKELDTYEGFDTKRLFAEYMSKIGKEI